MGWKRSGILLGALLALNPVMGAAAPALEASDAVLEIRTGGGVTGPFFVLSLDAAGVLSVTKRSLPLSKKDGGLSVHASQVTLAPETLAEVLSLAAAVDDFSEGCDVVGDGTSARMQLQAAGQVRRFECDNAAEWPVGAHSRRLIDALNGHLPPDFQLF